MSPITVDPAVYYAAAQAIRSEYAGVLDSVHNSLNPGLATSAGMAGNYPAAAPWVSRYSSVAADLEGVLVAYGNAVQTMGDMLELAGYTWAKAEHDANPATNKGGGPVSPPPRVGQTWDDRNIDIPDPMPAPYTTSDRGLRSNSDTFRDTFAAALRHGNAQVPTGDTDALDAASTAWRSFGDHDTWRAGPARIQAIAASFDTAEAPEKADILAMLGILAAAPTTVTEVAAGFATTTAAHAAALADLRSRLVANAAGAFPGSTVTAAGSNTAVTISFAEAPEGAALVDGAAALATAITGHTLYSLLAAAEFAAAENLSQLKARLEEIMSSPVDELVNRATWKSPAPKCELNPDGLRDYHGANDIVRGWIDDAVRYGNEAGVDPKQVLAVIFNEGGDRADTQLEQIGSGFWDATRDILNPFREATSPTGMGMSLGLTNIKEKTYQELQEQFPDQFGHIPWERVQYDDSFAIMAATFTMARIKDQYGPTLPDEIRERYSSNDFMAAGYNSEGAMDDYYRRKDLGPQVKQYVAMNDASYARASEIIDGAYTCR
ncbi:hypothetical protein [Nocardia asteroides]|uniref:hypothetical protein n=1 Tax=Nocardia asteroides TaxID=1824 RepID=UPI001E306DE9|nr:hypothetical protein [Nocardia asteroides]UGT64531.1 hypothetical protein LTT61_15130 [Nocardia asteroides]